MAEQPFKVRKLNVNGSYILASEFDPSSQGIYAPVPSLYFRIGYNSPYNIYIKTGSSDTDWIPLANKSVVDLLNFIFDATNEPSGFPVSQVTGEVDRTSSTISFNEGNRTFTIAPSGSSYYFFTKGVKYTKTSAINLQIPVTAGTYYFYFDTNGELQYTAVSSFPISIMLLNVFVAMVVWNGSQAVIIGDERHGCTMDAHTHARLHSNQGSVYLTGMALNNFVIDADGSSDTHAQFSIGSGTFRDEDILHTLSSIGATTSIPEVYRTGSGGGTWNIETKTNFKFLTSANSLIEYNSNSGTWARTEVGDNKYVLRHILATNDIRYPYVSLMGLAEYLNKSDARLNAQTELLSYTGLPFVEFVPIATYIIQSKTIFTNSVNAIIVTTDTGASYIDWRKTGTYLNPNVSGVNVHNNLGGLEGGGLNFYHSNQPINTTDIVTYAGIIDTGKLNVNFSSNSNTGTLSAISTLNTSAIRFSPSTTTSITGFNNAENGKLLWIHNAGSVDITIENESSTETTASNRIITGRNINILFKQNNSLLLQYDSTSSRWRFVTTVNSMNHNDLDNINGGSPYYHSDQSINKADSVEFANLLLSQNGTLTFEGSSNDDFETTLTVENPTADRTVTIPNATTTLVGTDVEQTLSLKTLTSPNITGTTTVTSTNTNVSPFTITANSLQNEVGIIKLSSSEPDILINQTSSNSDSTILFGVNDNYLLSLGKNSSDNFYIGRNNSGWVNDTLVISRTTGNLSISSTTDSTSISTGSFTTSGGVGITKNLNVGNNISIHNQYALQLFDSDSSNYIGFKAPSNVLNSVTFTVPIADGTNGQVITTNGAGVLSFTTINQEHNNLTGLQGGTNSPTSKYYHSDQEINIASSPSFAGMTIAGFTFPTVDGSANHVLTTNGSKGLSFAQVSHVNLSNIQGGTVGSYYHSNQQIDSTSDVTFKSVSITETLRYNTANTYSGAGGNLTSTEIVASHTNLRLNPSGIATIHGIDSTATGKVVILQNVSIYTITIANNSSTETTASKRIITGAEGSITLKTNTSITLIYDGTTSQWRAIGLNRHNNYFDLQGGNSGTDKFYHSDQEINIASSVQFAGINVNGAYSLPTALGSNGQSLISNGTGVVFGTPISTLDAYIIRYSASLNLDATTTLSTVTGSNASGRYNFWLDSDPRIRGSLYVKSSDLTNSELEISSTKIGTDNGMSNRLNVYFSSNNIVFENKIANDTLVIVKNI